MNKLFDISYSRPYMPKKKRESILDNFFYKCFECGKKHEKMIPLNIHHIDDNQLNNEEDNLIPLCISCHQKTKPHWKMPLNYRKREYFGNNFLVTL